MLGPYRTGDNGSILYGGNKIFDSIDNIELEEVGNKGLDAREEELDKEMWEHISKVNNQVHATAVNYFTDLDCLFTPLPLTTRMISSPGAVHGEEAIDYTDDTSPITVDWFDLDRNAFLSESSQIYLELALMVDSVDKVYSIYNSFRKEEADPTHLSEFHHIEFEGEVDYSENLDIAINLLKNIISDVLQQQRESLEFFLQEDQIAELKELVEDISQVKRITFEEAMNTLREHTGNPRYEEVSLKHFGSWEEIKLTEIYETIVIVEEFPLLEVPFYHREHPQNGGFAKNADIIWPGYREILGSGERIGDKDELEKKAEVFSLPKEDYRPYLYSREREDYTTTSGFGLGWERMVQGLLNLPFIWQSAKFPRTHRNLKP